MSRLKLTSLFLIIGTLAITPCQSGTITEFYYTPQIANLDAAIINNKNYLSANPKAGLNILINSIVNTNDSSLVPMSPNYWSGNAWTGLDPADRSPSSQRALKSNSSQYPGYGATVVQRDGYSVGMHLNTFDISTLPGNSIHTSLQYRTDINKIMWDKTDLLCMSGTMNLASSYTAGAVNQVMMTMYFEDVNIASKGFHLNVMMYDSRVDWQIKDSIVGDTDINSANLPIAISHMQTQGQNNSNYSTIVPGYGNPLAAFERGSAAPGNRDRGFCVGLVQFKNMLKDVAAYRPDKNYNQNPAAYILKYALVGPEMNIENGRGHVGMNVSGLWIYRSR